MAWISFVNHIFRKLEFFDYKINPNHRIKEDLKYTDEIKFWNVTGAEHLGTASHLLDPDVKNDKEFKEADYLYHKGLALLDNSERHVFAQISLKYAEELEKGQYENL